MPRRARLNVAGGVFHVVSRFVRDERWLDRPGAREAYLDLLGRAAATSRVEVLAYCLMSNHVHLVVVQGARPLERFTKSLHTGFAGWAHKHARGSKAQGPVFAERPRTVLVERDAYLLELVRYVHNNPVRAGVSRFARSSAWSSHQAYIGRSRAPSWLRMGYVLERFGKDARRAVALFDAFVDEGRKQARRPELSGSIDASEAAAVRRELSDGHRVSDGILGTAAFVARIRADSDRLTNALSTRGAEKRAAGVGRPTVRRVIDAVLNHKAVDALELVERPRSHNAAVVKRLSIWVWIHEYAGTQAEVGRALGLDTSMVSRYYGQAVAAAADFDEEAAAIVAVIKKQRRKSPKSITPATADAHRVRYHVDVDEV